VLEESCVVCCGGEKAMAASQFPRLPPVGHRHSALQGLYREQSQFHGQSGIAYSYNGDTRQSRVSIYLPISMLKSSSGTAAGASYSESPSSSESRFALDFFPTVRLLPPPSIRLAFSSSSSSSSESWYLIFLTARL